MMLERHREAVRALPTEARNYLITYFRMDTLPIVDEKKPEVRAIYLTMPMDQLLADRSLGHADVVLALLRGPRRLHREAERLVGQPIKRLPPVTMRPWPKAPPPSELSPADRRVVTRVGPNPRLPTTDSFQRYKVFRVGRTVEQLLKRGITRKDIREMERGGHVHFREGRS